MKSWNGTRVFVTGHTGFKGAWLSAWLVDLGAQVAGFSLAPETGRPNLFELAAISRRTSSEIGDIRDASRLSRAVRDFAPDIVFHLAAQPLVRRSYEDPTTTFETNVVGTANLLEAVRNCPSVRGVVCVTTDKVYANREWAWAYRETDRLGGSDPYSASKACAEFVAQSYAKSFFERTGRPALATMRGGNVIGGGDWSEDRLIPDVVRAIEIGAPIVLRNPGAVRPWQHVLELVHAYLHAGARLLAGDEAAKGAFNVGPDPAGELRVEELVRAFLRAWGSTAKVIVEPSPLAEANILRLDNSKIAADLGWSPVLDVRRALTWTADWYMRLARGEPAYRLIVEQIAEYRDLRRGTTP